MHQSSLAFTAISRGIPASNHTVSRDALDNRRLTTLDHGTRRFNVPLFNCSSHQRNVIRVVNPRLKLALPNLAVIYNSDRADARKTFKTLKFKVNAARIRRILTARALHTPGQPGALTVRAANQLNRKIATGSVVLTVVHGLNTTKTANCITRCQNRTVQTLDVTKHVAVYGVDVRVKTQTKVITPSSVAFRCVRTRRQPCTPGKSTFRRVIDCTHRLPDSRKTAFSHARRLSMKSLGPRID